MTIHAAICRPRRGIYILRDINGARFDATSRGTVTGFEADQWCAWQVAAAEYFRVHPDEVETRELADGTDGIFVRDEHVGFLEAV
jgi:hypothetical protein